MQLVTFNDLKIGDRFYYKKSYDFINGNSAVLKEKISEKQYCDIDSNTDKQNETSIKIFKKRNKEKIYLAR